MATSIATVEASEDQQRLSGVLREIAVGGLAGLLVGVFLGGVGGRVVMRLAALLVPDSVGRFTENGNRIGTISMDGTMALLIFGGLIAGTFAASLWVIVRPWLPAGVGRRTLVALPLVLGLGTTGLVSRSNPDFGILAHDPLVVASLVGLVALFAPAIAVTDAWLERRLPPGAARTPAGAAYGVVAAIGVLLTATIVAPTLLGGPLGPSAIAIAVVGVATLADWACRIADRARPPAVPIVARGAIVVAAVVSLAITVPEVIGALGIG